MKCPYSKRIITALAVIACTCGMNAEAASVGQLVASDSYNLYWGGSYNDVTKTGGSYNTALGSGTSAGMSVEKRHDGEYTTTTAQTYQYGMAWGKEARAANDVATAFGHKTVATGKKATAFGEKSVASGEASTAFGQMTEASADNATAFGYKTNASGKASTAFGSQNTASGQSAAAFGQNNKATGNSATAFGQDTVAGGRSAVAMGEFSDAAGDNSLAALGGQTLAAATGFAAVGNGAVAAVENTVALGSGSRADRKAGKDGYLKSAALTGAAWTSTANAISVGNVNGTDGSGNPAPVTRQITGIAAGSEDTDAVNVAQLKAAVTGASAVKAGSNISVSADNTVSLKDDVYLGGNHDAATSNIHLNGNDGTITANAKGDTFQPSSTMKFNKDGLTVSGTDGFGNNTNKTTTVKDGVVRVSDKSLASEHYTEIDGGTVRTEILKVNPDTQSRLKFDGGGLATNVGDSALSVDKKYIYQAVDDGSGRSNSMKIEKTGTTFKAAGIASAGTTTIEGKKVTAGDVVINGETGQSTIKGLTNKTLTAPDFAKAGRAATEEQLKVTDDKVTVLDGRVGTLDTQVGTLNTQVGTLDTQVGTLNTQVGTLNTQVGTLDTRVTTLDGRMDSVDAQIGTLSGRVDGVNDRINQLDGRINKVGAGAAALAALHPLDYDPAYKWDFAAGMGNYRNANAMAIGAFYRPNEVTMFSLGASIGDGGGMVNAGISLKVGPGVNGGTTRSGLMSKVQDLTAENKELKARDDAQDVLINQLRRELEALKDDLHK